MFQFLFSRFCDRQARVSFAVRAFQFLFLIATAIAASSVTGAPPAHAYGWCSMCGGDAACIKSCEAKLPSQRAPPPSHVPNVNRPKERAAIPAGLSQRNVQYGDSCRVDQKTRAATSWGSQGGVAAGGPYGGGVCCCHGGADKPTVLFDGQKQQCYCPDKSNATTQKCIANFEGAGACTGCNKVKHWGSAASGWLTDAAARKEYCCQGCKDTPTLYSKDFIKDSGMVEPLCTCPTR